MNQDDEKKIVNIICLLSSFMYIREKFQTLTFTSKDDKENLLAIESVIQKQVKYEHLADLNIILEKSYSKVKLFIEKDRFLREKLFNYISKLSSELEENDRLYILNSTIFMGKIDNNISEGERRMIVQISEALGLGRNFKKILNDYNNSEFVPHTKMTIILIAGIILVSLAIGIYFYNKESNKQINIFNEERIVFSEMSFNRYVIYKNKYNIQNNYFLKQAIFFFNGTAEVSIDPSRLKYDLKKHTLNIILNNTEYIFNLKTIFDEPILIDKVNPKPISEQDAKFVSGVIGVVGVGIGAKIGSKFGGFIGKVLPPQFKPFSTLISSTGGALIGGAGAYYVALKTLDGLQLSEVITKKEELEVIDNGKILLEKALLTDANLQIIYKERFEQYIKNKFVVKGFKINHINYIGSEND